jgi:hypothetical protein
MLNNLLKIEEILYYVVNNEEMAKDVVNSLINIIVGILEYVKLDVIQTAFDLQNKLIQTAFSLLETLGKRSIINKSKEDLCVHVDRLYDLFNDNSFFSKKYAIIIGLFICQKNIKNKNILIRILKDIVVMIGKNEKDNCSLALSIVKELLHNENYLDFFKQNLNTKLDELNVESEPEELNISKLEEILDSLLRLVSTKQSENLKEALKLIIDINRIFPNEHKKTLKDFFNKFQIDNFNDCVVELAELSVKLIENWMNDTNFLKSFIDKGIFNQIASYIKKSSDNTTKDIFFTLLNLLCTQNVIIEIIISKSFIKELVELLFFYAGIVEYQPRALEHIKIVVVENNGFPEEVKLVENVLLMLDGLLRKEGVDKGVKWDVVVILSFLMNGNVKKFCDEYFVIFKEILSSVPGYESCEQSLSLTESYSNKSPSLDESHSGFSDLTNSYPVDAAKSPTLKLSQHDQNKTESPKLSSGEKNSFAFFSYGSWAILSPSNEILPECKDDPCFQVNFKNISSKQDVKESGSDLESLNLSSTFTENRSSKSSVAFNGIIGSRISFYLDRENSLAESIVNTCKAPPIGRYPLLESLELFSLEYRKKRDLKKDVYVLQIVWGLFHSLKKLDVDNPTVKFLLGNSVKAKNFLLGFASLLKLSCCELWCLVSPLLSNFLHCTSLECRKRLFFAVEGMICNMVKVFYQEENQKISDQKLSDQELQSYNNSLNIVKNCNVVIYECMKALTVTQKLNIVLELVKTLSSKLDILFKIKEKDYYFRLDDITYLLDIIYEGVEHERNSRLYEGFGVDVLKILCYILFAKKYGPESDDNMYRKFNDLFTLYGKQSTDEIRSIFEELYEKLKKGENREKWKILMGCVICRAYYNKVMAKEKEVIVKELVLAKKMDKFSENVNKAFLFLVKKNMSILLEDEILDYLFWCMGFALTNDRSSHLIIIHNILEFTVKNKYNIFEKCVKEKNILNLSSCWSKEFSAEKKFTFCLVYLFLK